ncbi:liver carboxylesterase 4-like isoform X1 [Sitophilus oryzae]|uniref:Liver carboxylesterase 4-like isoform X1 n=1 Tax=Sitophilus oryzae TaxID=7048 RepID=A0A6J2XCD4_SITOR|nr:liver carboxylesterase 4-like isoform X1 [Sitophilus oryzae]
MRICDFFLCFSFMMKIGFGQLWQDRKIVVSVKQGLIEGKTEYTESRKIVNSFLGVPYAAPPVGNLRFSPPQRHPGWNGTYQATKHPPRCAQLPIKSNYSEDCLYLNIWSPVSTGSYAPLPVVVLFEGIDFFQSSDLPYLPGQDFSSEGVILVTVNYRLNIFGFFCLGTNEARGNLGLLDQYYAIVWIKENIKNFRGDPEKVTLFGCLSGAVSVALHLISPRTSGLFQRAVLISGSALAPWQVNNDPIAASNEMLRILGCNLYTTDYLRCLRSKKTEDILQTLQEYSESLQWTDAFLPVVDNFLPENNRYLPYDPSKAFREATFFQVPILTGISKPITFPETNVWYELASKGFQQLNQYMDRAKILEILRAYRFSNSTNRDQLVDMIKWKYSSPSQGDVRILVDQIKQLEFEAKIEAPHFLQLSHLTSYVQPIYVYYMPDLGFNVNTTDSFITTDMLLLFGPSLLKAVARRRFVEDEARLSADLKKMFINFIMFGNPTPSNNRIRQWRKYNPNDPYIEDFYKATYTQADRVETVSFWNNLLPKISKYRTTYSLPRELQNSPDPAAAFRHGMYTLVGLVAALLGLLVICIILLKRKNHEREREFHIGY